MNDLYFVRIRDGNMDRRRDPSQMLDFGLAGHFPDGLNGDAGGDHFMGVGFGVGGSGGCGGGGTVGLRVTGVTGTPPPNRVLCLGFFFVVVCLNRAVHTATASSASRTHHVPATHGTGRG